MDKTTTWLVRGASAIVIIFGVGYFVKPQITKFANYISKSRAEKTEYNKLSDEDKSYYDFTKAINRCSNLEEISYSEFIKKLDNNEIKKWFDTPIGVQINTSRGKYIVQENKDGSKPKYDWQYGKDAGLELLERKINEPQSKYFRKAEKYYLKTGQELYIPEIYTMVCK